MPIQTAIILAGGCGRRIWPYNEVRNKCTLPVANVPNVRRLADSLSEIGVRRIVVVIGAFPGSVRNALLGCDAEIRFVEQPSGAGTAGAALAGLGAVDDDAALIVYGDTVTSSDNLRLVLGGFEQGD